MTESSVSLIRCQKYNKYGVQNKKNRYLICDNVDYKLYYKCVQLKVKDFVPKD